jgi:hypothetical protein
MRSFFLPSEKVSSLPPSTRAGEVGIGGVAFADLGCGGEGDVVRERRARGETSEGSSDAFSGVG